MITACFARALQRCTSRLGMHLLLTFQEVMPISKTRNQLSYCLDPEYHGQNADPVERNLASAALTKNTVARVDRMRERSIGGREKWLYLSYTGQGVQRLGSVPLS